MKTRSKRPSDYPQLFHAHPLYPLQPLSSSFYAAPFFAFQTEFASAPHFIIPHLARLVKCFFHTGPDLPSDLLPSASAPHLRSDPQSSSSEPDPRYTPKAAVTAPYIRSDQQQQQGSHFTQDPLKQQEATLRRGPTAATSAA